MSYISEPGEVVSSPARVETIPAVSPHSDAASPCPVRLSSSSNMASKPETDSDTQDVPFTPPISLPKLPEKKVMVNSASQSMGSPPGRNSLDNGDSATAGSASSAAGDLSSPPHPRQILNRSTTRSSSSSFSESLDPALDPSSLPPPDPWLESGNGSGGSGVAASQSGGGSGGTLCRRDGHWFLKLLQAETGRMEGWCQQMEQETKDNQLSEEGKAEGAGHGQVEAALLVLIGWFSHTCKWCRVPNLSCTSLE